MNLSDDTLKRVRELIVFSALLVVALWKMDAVIGVLKGIWGILLPFVLGGAIAFMINVPMSFLEERLFGKAKERGSSLARKLARPLSLLLTVLLVVGVIVLVLFGVIPQLTKTVGTLMATIADFIPQMQNWIREFSHNNREIMGLVEKVHFDPNEAISWLVSILGSGTGNVMNTTVTAVSRHCPARKLAKVR